MFYHRQKIPQSARLRLLLRTCLESLVCFLLPLSSLGFLLTAPHGWQAALVWTLPVWLCIVADYLSPDDLHRPALAGVRWWLDARLYLLFGLQLTNIWLLLGVCSELAWQTPAEFAESAANIAAMRILQGTTSCCSGIAVAHELLHRRAKHLRWMGRILLWTVCYDHFAFEHARGHHRLVGTHADPATARYGEGLEAFFRRSLSGQWLNAWQMETQRLNPKPGTAWLWRHRLLHGMVVQFGLWLLIATQYGFVALLMFLYQAYIAVRMLEAVNYLQHWGLSRRHGNFRTHCAWVTDSWFTLHTFVGLSRHIDHHNHAGKPCYRLQARAKGPRLPHGYFVMFLLVRLHNRRYIELAKQELHRLGLAPGQTQADWPTTRQEPWNDGCTQTSEASAT